MIDIEITSSDIVTDSTTIITNVGEPKIVTGTSRADIYIGISTNALCKINLSLQDDYFSSGGTCQVERLASQQNMYALYLSIPNYYYSSGQAEFRTWNFAMTATTCDSGIEKTTEFSIKQLGCSSTCTITWKNHDGTTLDTDSVQIGTIPSYSGPTPTKESTAQYTYTFAGWTPTIVAASVDTAYTATFSCVTRTYTILWKNYNGNTLEIDENVPYGDTPSYDGNTPSKPSDAEHSYTFNGWSPATATVTGDQTYTAQFIEVVNRYTITWNDWDGTEFDHRMYNYGDMPTHEDPDTWYDETYRHIFDRWNPEIGIVTQDQTYTAVYRSEYRDYYVTWVMHNSSETSSYHYGETPQHSEPSSYDDGVYRYTFDYWTPSIVPVTGNTTYTAVYDKKPLTYTVTWNNGGDRLQTDENVPYGTVVTYQGEEPQKEPDEAHTYTFTGWSPTVGPITGDTDYEAQFRENVRNYTVSFNMNGYGTQIPPQTISYDGYATRPAEPVDDEYIFIDWYSDSEFNEAWEFDDYNVDNDVILYAKWEHSCRVIKCKVNPNENLGYQDELSGFNFGNGVGFSSVKEIVEQDFSEANVICDNCITALGNYDTGKTFQDEDIIEVILPSSLKVLDDSYRDDGIFNNSGLRKADLSNITKIGAYTFEGCDFYAILLDTEANAEKIRQYNDMGGCAVISSSGLTEIGESAFGGNANIIEAEIPSGITELDKTFIHSISLTSVTIPNSVTAITNQAFSLSGLRTVTLPNKLKTIGRDAFKGANLTTITIPDSVTTIGKEAFSSCNYLTTAIIGSGVTSIGRSAFNCSSITSIKCEAQTPPTIDSVTFENVDKSIPLKVPRSSIFAYRSHEYWGEFTNISDIMAI